MLAAVIAAVLAFLHHHWRIIGIVIAVWLVVALPIGVLATWLLRRALDRQR